jgi:hypothetical protein
VPGRFPVAAGRLVMTIALAATAIQLLQACTFSPPENVRTSEGLYAVLNRAP